VANAEDGDGKPVAVVVIRKARWSDEEMEPLAASGVDPRGL